LSLILSSGFSFFFSFGLSLTITFSGYLLCLVSSSSSYFSFENIFEKKYPATAPIANPTPTPKFNLFKF
jgi:hypothetical protein